MLVHGLKIPGYTPSQEERARYQEHLVHRLLQKLYRSIASFCKTVAYRIILNHIHKHRHDTSVINDRHSENKYVRAVMHDRVG